MTHSPELETTFEIVQRLSKAGGEPWEKFKALLAKFDPPAPPVEYDYPMPEWAEFQAAHLAPEPYGTRLDQFSYITKPMFNAIREATKTPRKPAPKLGREWRIARAYSSYSGCAYTGRPF